MTSAPYATAMMPPGPPGAARQRDHRVAFAFVAVIVLSQLGLILPGMGGLRVAWRMASFVVSLGLMVGLRGRSRRLPVALAAFWVLVLATLSMFNPLSNSPLAALADCAMYFAVLAPIFWVPRLRLNLVQFRKLILVLWLFSVASMSAGLLQVYFPGQFEPTLSPIYNAKGPLSDEYKIVLANGKQIFRPMGLTDAPGGAAADAMWSILFGIGFMLTTPFLWRKLACGAVIVGGIVCVVLSQSRASLVGVGIWALALAVILAGRRMYRYLFLLLLGVAIAGYYGGGAASRVAGSKTLARLQPLGAGHGSASELYANERGYFLRQTFEVYLPEFPLGAGMGRWGMMNYYFGTNGDPQRGTIYVEIQWTAWLLDGGIPMILAYLIAIGAALWGLVKVMRRRNPMWFWAALIIAYDVGTVAICFDYTPFTGQSGIEFWFLNALVLTAAVQMPAAMWWWPTAPAMPPQGGWRRA